MINAAERLSKRVRTAMGDHNNDDLPVTQCVINMRKEVVSLQAENEKLRSIISDLKDWDCDVSAGFLSIPLDLRRRMHAAMADRKG